jgi:transcriptional regulator with PAS, ATPase and Fis domain
MPIHLQVHLLRALENGAIRRVGGTEDIEVDVRIVAATNTPPLRAIAEGKLREDLYYRLNVFSIELPPLRARREEVLPLARRFLAQQRRGQGLGGEASAALEAYDWPGNVRELRNVMERAAILTLPDAEVALDALPPLSVARASEAQGTLDHAERALVERALETHAGNILAAARELGVSRGLLYRKIAKYGITVKR